MSEHYRDVDAYVAAVLKRIPRAAAERGRIAADVRTHILERMEAGQTKKEAIEQMGVPEEVARAYLQDMVLPPAPHVRRLCAFMIDLLLGAVVIVFALALVRPFGVGAFWPGDEIHWWWILSSTVIVLALSAALLSVLYFPFLEARYGQTLGKRLMGLCVVTESWEQIGWGAAILRRLPVFLEFVWLDALFALFTRRRQRAFDLIAKTVVVRCS